MAHDLATTLTSSPLFKQAPEVLVSELTARCPVQHLPRGTTLLSPDRPNNCLFLVLSGELQVLIGVSGSAASISVVPGECVGEMSVIDGGRVSAPVVAARDTELLIIDLDTFWSLTDRHPTIARSLLGIMAERMRKTNSALADSIKLQQTYEHWVHIDPLTGAFNRRWLDEMLTRYIERARGDNQPFVLALFDLDHFKKYNDRCGHLAGDDALRSTARAVQRCVRPADQLARFGGEEFCLLLPDTDLAAAQPTAGRVLSTVAGNKIEAANGKALPTVTISLGLAALRPDDTPNHLLDAADQALYRAKRGGRNRVAT